MYHFILKSKPLSYNSCTTKKRVNYKKALQESFTTYNTTHTVLSGELYALVYYFFKKNLYLDTDNISKPVWDCLNGFLFTDDQQIKMRTAGSFDLTNGDFTVIDVTGLDGKLAGDLLDAFGSEDHIVYVECGKFNPSMFKFSLE